MGDQRVWIGLNDVEREGDWRWVSGEPVTYTNFQHGQPDNAKGREDFVELRGNVSGKWNDHESPKYKKRGLVEVKIKELEEQQRAILENLVKWAVENNALDQISDIIPYDNERLESLSDHLAEYNRLKTEQLAKEEHLPQIVDNAAVLLRPVFLDNHPDNATAIDVLQDETEELAHKYESQLATLKAEEAHNNAEASTAIVQADYHENKLLMLGSAVVKRVRLGLNSGKLGNAVNAVRKRNIG